MFVYLYKNNYFLFRIRSLNKPSTADTSSNANYSKSTLESKIEEEDPYGGSTEFESDEESDDLFFLFDHLIAYIYIF